MKSAVGTFCLLFLFVASQSSVEGALITFDQVLVGETVFAFDGDADGVDDVLFSTTDPSGFNTIGLGPDMSFINDPGLEGTSRLSPDLRVDFLNGAIGPFSFGFALSSGYSHPSFFASINVFNTGGSQIASAIEVGDFTLDPSFLGFRSTYPEGVVTVNFSGIASYATFDFASEHGRYTIDNFQGTFGSTEAVPEPSTLLLLGTGLVGLVGYNRRKRKV